MFDNLITTRLYHYLRVIIPAEQHGFMTKRNTTTNLMQITQSLHRSIRVSLSTDVIYILIKVRRLTLLISVL